MHSRVCYFNDTICILSVFYFNDTISYLKSTKNYKYKKYTM